MASIARQMPRDLFPFDFRTLLDAAVAKPFAADRSDPLPDDDLTVRSVASAGLAALFGLPFLMLSSVVLDAPLAAPAAIALGYLAISHALASRRPRRAALISGAVLSALVGWLLAFLLGHEASISRAGFAAALMAPLFAAAPAFARSIIAPRNDPSSSRLAARLPRDIALQRVAQLDELTPAEAVLFLDQDGTVLAATCAARRRLRLLPDAFEHHVSSIFDPPSALRVLDAVRRCAGRAAPLDIKLAGDETGEVASAEWTLAADNAGAVAMQIAMRLKESPPKLVDSTTGEGRRVGTGAALRFGPICDVAEAVAFALRLAAPKAQAKRISLTTDVDREIAAACDRQIGRRIAHLLIESAMKYAAPGAAVCVDARRLKGIVLLRAATETAIEEADIDPGTDTPFELGALRAVVERADGTLVTDRRQSSVTLSVRLELADAAMAKERVGDRAQAQ